MRFSAVLAVGFLVLLVALAVMLLQSSTAAGRTELRSEMSSRRRRPGAGGHCEFEQIVPRTTWRPAAAVGYVRATVSPDSV